MEAVYLQLVRSSVWMADSRVLQFQTKIRLLNSSLWNSFQHSSTKFPYSPHLHSHDETPDSILNSTSWKCETCRSDSINLWYHKFSTLSCSCRLTGQCSNRIITLSSLESHWGHNHFVVYSGRLLKLRTDHRMLRRFRQGQRCEESYKSNLNLCFIVAICLSSCLFILFFL